MSDRCALLLRAVNVSGANRVPMAELRTLLTERSALQNVSTYIASGNVICDAPVDREAACAEVRALIADEFGVDTPVIARTHTELVRAERDDPFDDASLDKMVHAMFLEGDASPGAVDQLTARMLPGERIALIGRELWIDFGQGGVASTKLTRPVLDRALGTASTGRNRNTVRKLVQLTAPS
ncbi:DUF1697 domain-containing protein [Microbacterium esteraromaticum]|uniref:DUF1697 domain-containing protein n=1 Tax=Microbacterium esteraromaticum TaxID=57043 RepID=A0A7D7W6J4_9MICO|nr:DUF1697 domain-containing protein [Microbacterium esteraromaticum]QMU96055.1 DUF1697 domain-containing protein [Microbacterium esteraromaticum]